VAWIYLCTYFYVNSVPGTTIIFKRNFEALQSVRLSIGRDTFRCILLYFSVRGSFKVQTVQFCIKVHFLMKINVN